MVVKYEDDDIFLSPKKEDTQAGWEFILNLCRKKVDFGFGALDSFLSGPDAARRVELVLQEANTNEWLRFQLKDTLSLLQTKDLSEEQINRLRAAITI